MDKQEYAPSIPSIPHIAHHIEYAEEIVDDFVARQKKEWKQEMIESTRKRLYKLYGGIFPTFKLFCEALDEINNVPFACLVINNTSHSDDKVMIYIAPEWPDWRVMIVQMDTRRMMLSFVPKLDLSRLATPGNPFQKSIHRCFVMLDPGTTSVADIMRTAYAKLGAHLQLRAAYKREPISPFKILSIWAFNDGPVGVAVPLASADDYLLSDAVVSRNHESGFGAASPHEDGLRFMVLPSEISIRMLMITAL
eukprot:gene32094-biopygen9568